MTRGSEEGSETLSPATDSVDLLVGDLPCDFVIVIVIIFVCLIFI